MNLISNHNLYSEIVARLEKKSGQVRWNYIISPRLHPGETLLYRPNLAKRGNSGTLYLYTERFICSGCEESIRDFKDMFPKINIFVFWGEDYP